MKHKLLIHSAKQIVQVVAGKEKMLSGNNMKHLMVLNANPDSGLSLIVDSSGLISFIGHDNDLQDCMEEFEEMIDASDCALIPGFVDSHTHPVWSGDRIHEFAMKLNGASYLEIQEAGGGIHFTVQHTQEASEEDLYRSLQHRLMRMFKCGTTTVECKSGYGLDLENELKLLRVIERARKELPLDITTTFCGAHAVPRHSTAEAATNDIVNNQLPAIRSEMRKGNLHVDSIDVFCEESVFDVRLAKAILKAGRRAGLRLNFHGDELTATNSAQMGALLCAEAISHLEKISEEGIKEIAKSGSVAIILPTTAFLLHLTPPPVRKMIEAGVAVALGSDFNPNAYCLSMATVMHLACVMCNMTLNEALVASTINAAASMGKSRLLGSLEVGKQGDILVINAPRWDHIIYQLGEHESLIKCVIKKGCVYFKSDSAPSTHMH